VSSTRRISSRQTSTFASKMWRNSWRDLEKTKQRLGVGRAQAPKGATPSPLVTKGWERKPRAAPIGGRMTSQAQAISPLSGVRGLVFLGFPLHPAGRPSDERGDHLLAISGLA
jgi:predicted alpha/beta-hydrolase family hydrolase